LAFSFHAKFQGFLLQGALALQALVRGLPFWEDVRKIFGIELDLENLKEAMELY